MTAGLGHTGAGELGFWENEATGSTPVGIRTAKEEFQPERRCLEEGSVTRRAVK